MAKLDMPVAKLSVLALAYTCRDDELLWRTAQEITLVRQRLPADHSHTHGEHNRRRLVFNAVKDAFGLDLRTARSDLTRLEGASRIDAARAGLKDEKTLSASPKQGLTLVKGLAGKPVHLHSGEYPVQIWGANVPITEIDLAQHSAILVVENWASFQEIDHVRLSLAAVGDTPIVVYRGDEAVRNRSHKDLCLLARDQGHIFPIVAFMDLDPMGVMLADAIPGLTTFLHPENPEQLPTSLESFQRQRESTQLRNWQPKQHACQAIWRIIIENNLAVSQERF